MMIQIVIRKVLVIISVIICLAVAICPFASAQSGPPNVVLIMADDHGWEETGYNDHPIVKTPVLDSMAEEGLRFDRFYAAAPVCSPTRGSVLTGRHPNRFGTFSWNHSIRPEEITLAEVLRDAGYATGHFGKWHLGPVKASSPTNPGASGFEEFLSHDNYFDLNPALSRNGEPPQIHLGEGSEVVVEEAIRFIDDAAEAERPFFTVIWFGSPHAPYIAPRREGFPVEGIPPTPASVDFEGMYEEYDIDNELRDRYVEITLMDRAIGRLRSHLRNKELAENTIVWYCSDNGVPGGSTYEPSLRGHKGNLYENGVRVPAVIEWPAGIPDPIVSEMPAVTSDILPTILDIIGLPLPNRPLDGISLRPVWENGMVERPEPIYFWEHELYADVDNEPWIDPDLQTGTVPTGDWRTENFFNHHHPEAKTEDFGGPAAVVDGRYKLFVDAEGDLELYDLGVDQEESTNLAGEKSELAAELKRRLEDWQASVERSLTGADY